MTDISWFMKALNEHIAKKANITDNVKGHFWEHRFTSIPIYGKEQLIETMAYIDLNPLRATVVKCPEEAHFTSFKRRTEGLRLSKMKITKEDILKQKFQNINDNLKTDILQNIDISSENLKNENIWRAFGFECFEGIFIGLEPLEDEFGHILRNHIDLSTEEYLRFVDMQGREIRDGKKGFIAKNQPPIIERIFIEKFLLA